MAESEQLLETCVCSLMGLGFDQLPNLYRLLAKKSLMKERSSPMEVRLKEHADWVDSLNSAMAYPTKAFASVVLQSQP